MSMSTALENFWARRLSRLGHHERLEQHHQEEVVDLHDDELPQATAPSSSNTSVTSSSSSSTDNNHNGTHHRRLSQRGTTMNSSSREEMVIITNNNTRPTTSINDGSSDGMEAVVTNEGLIMVDPETMTIQLPQRSSSRAINNNSAITTINNNSTVSLEELQEERELARRRTGACVLCAVFVLFLLWIQALTNGDFGQLLLCLVGTSWTARWIRHNREREEELDRRIALYLEHAEPGTTELNRSDLRMLSFQAQLALAIMESQRQMMMGGFGHPDGGGAGNENPGVSNEAKQRWERFTYKTIPPGDEKATAGSPKHPPNKKGGYGTVPQQQARKVGIDEEANCSICLSDYEEGEHLVCLPCRHVYHEECVGSWTSNHTRCPLCNFDLESVADTASAHAAAREISIV